MRGYRSGFIILAYPVLGSAVRSPTDIPLCYCPCSWSSPHPRLSTPRSSANPAPALPGIPRSEPSPKPWLCLREERWPCTPKPEPLAPLCLGERGVKWGGALICQPGVENRVGKGSVNKYSCGNPLVLQISCICNIMCNIMCYYT